MANFKRKLESAKRSSTAHLLIKCGRLVNEFALATLKHPATERGDGSGPRPAHMALFPHIDLDEGARVTELATKLGISKQAVGQLVDDLEGYGMVERMPDPHDGRAKRVCFTPMGKSSMLEGLAHLKSVDKELARAVGPASMNELHRALLALHDHLDRG